MEPHLKRTAIIVTTGQPPEVPHFTTRYYGESLLGRALIGLHKVGIERAVIVMSQNDQPTIGHCISEISHRIRVQTVTCVQEKDQSLSDAIRPYVDPNMEYIVFQLDQIVHPSLLKSVVQLSGGHDFAAFAFANISMERGKITGLENIPKKFAVIFHNKEHRRCIPSGVKDSQWVSSDIFVFSGTVLAELNYQFLDDLLQTKLSEPPIHVEFISDAWCFKVRTDTSKQDIETFFWGIAFKEISGEFSKAVNSKFSKPLSLWLSQMQVAPNTISSAQLILYALASLFLLWPEPWAFIPFAVIWQFAAGVLDRCDGETARIRNYESEDGAKYDVLIDDLRFLIPFAAVTARAWLLNQELIYILVFGATMAVFLILTSLEIRFMRRKGYLSRQVMGVDYTKSLESDTAWARFFRRFRPFFKGDARTFMISVLSLSLNTLLIFWLFVANIIYMALQGAVLVWQLRSKNTTPTAHNAELVRS
jgi:phosphatidylglycerophosphate synthase